MRGVQNVEMSIESLDENRILTIRVNLETDFGSSKSGKSRIIATTGGGVQYEGVKVNLNVYK